MSINPFTPAEQVIPKMKALIWGESGVGKTTLALTAPGRVAVIDTEGGTAFHANRKGLSAFDVLTTKTFNDVSRAVAYLREHPGEYETLVIDPVTVLYETLQDAAQARRARIRQDEDAELEQLDWQLIKRRYKELMTDVVNLPMHVLVTAREKDDTVRKGKQSEKVGVKPDAEKSTVYYFDVTIRLIIENNKRVAIVSKDRTTEDAAPSVKVAGPTFDKLFSAALTAGSEATGERFLQSEADATARDVVTTFAGTAKPEEELRPATEPHVERTGVVKRGNGFHSNLEVRQNPDGYSFGFRLEFDGGSIAQVVCTGQAGLAVMMAIGENVETLLGQTVTVAGDLFEVHYPGRRMYYRLIVTAIRGDGFSFPADDESSAPVPPPAESDATEAPSIPLFDDKEQAAIDAALAEAAS